MSRFDDELRRATAPLAGEPLPAEVLDDALNDAPGTTRVPWAGAAVVAVVVLAVAVAGGGPLLGRGGPMVSPSAPPSVVPPSVTVAPPTAAPTPAPTPSLQPTRSVGPSRSPRPSASATPSAEPGAPVVASTESDGIVVTLHLDRDVARHGQRVWATVTIENVGVDSVWWGHSSTCVWPGGVGAIPVVPSEVLYGRDDWPGRAGVLKSTMVMPFDTPDRAFVHEEIVNYVGEGTRGCTTDFVTSEFPAGAQLSFRAAWDTLGPEGMPPAPGYYDAVATFGYLGRGASPPADPGIPQPTVTVTAPMFVDGPDIAYLWPGQAVDRALADEDFSSRVTAVPRERWDGSDIRFEDGVWVIELLLTGPEEALVAKVDPISGEVITVEVQPREAGAGE